MAQRPIVTRPDYTVEVDTANRWITVRPSDGQFEEGLYRIAVSSDDFSRPTAGDGKGVVFFDVVILANDLGPEELNLDITQDGAVPGGRVCLQSNLSPMGRLGSAWMTVPIPGVLGGKRISMIPGGRRSICGRQITEATLRRPSNSLADRSRGQPTFARLSSWKSWRMFRCCSLTCLQRRSGGLPEWRKDRA